MIYIPCRQGTDEWATLRAGKISASRFRDATETLKGSKPSAKSIAYAAQVAVERISGVPSDEGFVNWQMKRGTELEPAARLAYEAYSGNVVEESGIALTEDEVFAYSSDGFIGSDGAIEVKCVVSAEKLISIWRDHDPAEYLYQVMGGLWLTGRKWCDLVVYAPQLATVEKDLFVLRIQRDEAFIEALEQDLLKFADRVFENERVLRMPMAA